MLPMEAENHEEYGRVEKFVIPYSKKGSIRKSLNGFGINSLSIYPSVESVARRIRDEYLMDRSPENGRTA